MHRYAYPSDPTGYMARRGLGELKDRLPAHDIHEPTPLERVYVLLDREVCQVKIGWTSRSVKVRQRDIEYARGRKLELLGAMRGGRTLEKCLHARFSDYRSSHRSPEWFSSEILAEVIPMLDEPNHAFA